MFNMLLPLIQDIGDQEVVNIRIPGYYDLKDGLAEVIEYLSKVTVRKVSYKKNFWTGDITVMLKR